MGDRFFCGNCSCDRFLRELMVDRLFGSIASTILIIGAIALWGKKMSDRLFGSMTRVILIIGAIALLVLLPELF